MRAKEIIYDWFRKPNRDNDEGCAHGCPHADLFPIARPSEGGAFARRFTIQFRGT